MAKIYAVVPAAGSGSRMMAGEDGVQIKKQFIKLKGKEILAYTLDVLESVSSINGIVLVASKDDIDLCNELVKQYGYKKVLDVVKGGSRRQNSVLAGLSAVPKDADMVVIHDGARPFVTPEEVEATIRTAERVGGAVLAVPVTDTIKVVGPRSIIEETPPRSGLYSAQTPQTFKYPDILEGYRHAVVFGDMSCTDDSEVMEKYMDIRIEIVQGSYENIKITTPKDLLTAEKILEKRGL